MLGTWKTVSQLNSWLFCFSECLSASRYSGLASGSASSELSQPFGGWYQWEAEESSAIIFKHRRYIQITLASSTAMHVILTQLQLLTVPGMWTAGSNLELYFAASCQTHAGFKTKVDIPAVHHVFQKRSWSALHFLLGPGSLVFKNIGIKDFSGVHLPAPRCLLNKNRVHYRNYSVSNRILTSNVGSL